MLLQISLVCLVKSDVHVSQKAFYVTNHQFHDVDWVRKDEGMVRGLNQGQVHKGFEDLLPLFVRVSLVLVIVLLLLRILHFFYLLEDDFAEGDWRTLKPDALVLTAV